MNELKQAISKGTLSSLYILYGEEAYLREHYLKLMRKGVGGFDYKKIDGISSSMRDVAEAVQSMPMSGDRVFIEVRDLDIFARDFGEANAGILESLIGDIPDTCRLVFVYSAVEWKPDKRRKLWKSLEKYAKIVEFKAQDERELINWIERHFGAEGKSISKQNAQFLIRYCGRLMNTLGNEIAKISAYSNGVEITESDIRAVTPPQLEAGVFEVADAIIRGEFGNASRMFGTLLELHKDELREQAIPIIAALSWKLRREYQSQLRFGRRSPMLDWSANAILLCADADTRCKSSNADERVILTDLFVTLLAAKYRTRR
ncbi:MAG: DNA polymerase III subunit delta [Oscillospiraceae bacterium]|jgi:DNA polymerase-3 subunit delta|nr:DNA polymerase III subunit delta [Oscillospiraceae bacterium]